MKKILVVDFILIIEWNEIIIGKFYNRILYKINVKARRSFTLRPFIIKIIQN